MIHKNYYYKLKVFFQIFYLDFLGTYHTDIKRKTKILISPHNDYDECGDIISSVFAKVDNNDIKTIFVFGPNHYEYQKYYFYYKKIVFVV